MPIASLLLAAALAVPPTTPGARPAPPDPLARQSAHGAPPAPGAQPQPSAARPTVAGRPFTPPPECTLRGSGPAGGMLECPDGTSLTWLAGEKKAVKELRAKLEKTTEEALSKGYWLEDARCTLEGVASTCLHRVGMVGGQPHEAWLATATVRGKHLVAWCLHPRAATVPPACAHLFKVPTGKRPSRPSGPSPHGQRNPPAQRVDEPAPARP
jgi:hypothetical protein